MKHLLKQTSFRHFYPELSTPNKERKTSSKLLLLPLFFLMLSFETYGQSSFIYVHKKTLNEESSLNFSFSLTGGPTSVPNFTLNDQPDNLKIADIGADRSGGLWAAATGQGLYYRAAGGASWVKKVSGDIQRVDGAQAGTCYYILGNQVYYYNGSTSSLVGLPGSANAVDIASNGTYTVATNSNGKLYRVNTSTFTSVTVPTGLQATYVDLDVAGNVYLREKSSSINPYRVSKLTAAGAFSVYPTGGFTSNQHDVAVSDDGAILLQAGPEGSSLAYRYNGSTWISEPESRGVIALAGGPGGQMWSIFYISPKATTILTRTYTGTGPSGSTSAFWVDDERVRTTFGDNSAMIPVNAGTYTLAETIPAGWDVTNVTIYDPTTNSTSNVANGSASINVSAGETVHVIVENTLFQSTTVASNCGNTFTETFGTGASGTAGVPLPGLTSYHNVNTARQIQDGEYSIVSKSADAGYGSMFDHTAGNGTGRMLAVNAAYSKDIFYTRRFNSMVTGANYDLSIWTGSITTGISPNINMEVYNAADNSLLASLSTGNITVQNKWLNFHLPFTPTTPNIYIVLRNNNIGGDGNDLVIDDISFGLTCDHGDAPDSYGTTNANTGAGHIIAPSLTIGATVDQEPDGIPNAGALGDDQNGTDDEDGVALFPAINVSTTTYDLTIAVNNKIGTDAILSGWIDFNRNGIFDSGERAQVTVNKNAKSVTLHWAGLSGLSGGITYARFRLATLASDVENPTGAANNGEVEDYLLNININISGNVFDDANGLKDNLVNGTGTNLNALKAVLYNNTTGKIEAVVNVAADGTYNFDAAAGNNYSVYITTNSATVGNVAPPAVVLPTNWVNTGEHLGADSGSDGSINGILVLGAVNANVTNANFGIDQIPDSDNKMGTLPAQPVVNQFITLDASVPNVQFLTGSDPEDQSSSATLSGKAVAITSLPINGELWYNNVRITFGADGINPPSPANPFLINNLDPSLLQIKLTGSGYITTSFTYAYVDAAGVADPTPATYTLNWASPLPVTLIRFTAVAEGQSAFLSWTTSSEINSDRFDIQRSQDGKDWKVIGSVSASGESKTTVSYSFTDKTPFTGQNLYRLKMIDLDNSFTFSRINNVLFENKFSINVYPNPASDQLFISSVTEAKIYKVQIYNTIGQMVKESYNTNSTDISQIRSGIYNVRVTLADGTVSTRKIMIK